MKQLKLLDRERERERERKERKRRQSVVEVERDATGSGKHLVGNFRIPKTFRVFFLSTPIAPSTIPNAQGGERTMSFIRLSAMDSIQLPSLLHNNNLRGDMKYSASMAQEQSVYPSTRFCVVGRVGHRSCSISNLTA